MNDEQRRLTHEALDEALDGVDSGWQTCIKVDGEDAWRNTPPSSVASLVVGGRRIRRKPTTIRIGAYDVPEPLRVEPPEGSCVFIADALRPNLWCTTYYHDSEQDRVLFRRGLLHDNEEAATLHGRALASLTAQGGAITLDVAKVSASPQGKAMLEKNRKIKVEG